MRPFLLRVFELSANKTTFILDALPWSDGGVFNARKLLLQTRIH